MRTTLKTLSLLVIIVAGFSCEEAAIDSPPLAVDRKAIETFIYFFDMGVESLAVKPPKDADQATAIIVEKIPEIKEQIGIDFQLDYTRGQSVAREPVGGSTDLSTSRAQLMNKIVNYSKVSTSASNYLSNLKLLEAEIYASGLTRMQKSELLTLLVLNEEFVRYLDGKVRQMVRSGDQVTPAMKCNGWWNCWGKCVAGTVGGAGLGVLTGAAYGGVGCTMVLPVVGTVACGTVGAIAGGVFGGLAGAAAAC